MTTPSDDSDVDVPVDGIEEVTDMSAPDAPPVAASARPRAKLVALGSGRGGTGRSLLAANIAVYLAQSSKKVVALVIESPIAGIGLIAGDGSAFGAPRPKVSTKAVLAAMTALDVDYVVVD